MTYYTLLTRDNATSKWHPQFGDYDRAVVVEERAVCCESQMGPRKSDTHILKTSSDEQHVISAAIDALNGEALHR